jgi:hypothetical protein
MVKHYGDQVSGFLTRRISKWNAKTKRAIIDPLLTFHDRRYAMLMGNVHGTFS